MRQTISHFFQKEVSEKVRLLNISFSDEMILQLKETIEKENKNQYIIWLTWTIWSWKSYIANQLTKEWQALGYNIHNIDLDSIGHELLMYSDSVLAKETRRKITHEFWEDVLENDWSINKQKLSEIVFSSQEKLDVLNKMMRKPMILRTLKKIEDKEGIIILNGAIICDFDRTIMCNNKIVFIDTDEHTRIQRIMERDGIDRQKAVQKSNAQLWTKDKINKLSKKIDEFDYGDSIVFENDQPDYEDIQKLLSNIVEKI